MVKGWEKDKGNRQLHACFCSLGSVLLWFHWNVTMAPLIHDWFEEIEKKRAVVARSEEREGEFLSSCLYQV